MRIPTLTFCLILCTLFFSQALQGQIEEQEHVLVPVVGRLDSLELGTATGEAFSTNLDSMLQSWYVSRALKEADEDYDRAADTIVPVFHDSVYMARLAEIPSVVDLTYNKIVRNYIHVYTRKRRQQVRLMLGLADYYFPQFEEIFDLYDVPYEIKYLSVIESALNPRAISPVGAVGTWQFMYGTGRHYGLTINSLVDERRDPFAASHAAARYMRDLYRIYNDWTLALAAYNCGPGNVNKAIRRSGGKRNFWDIYYFLPRETRGHIPAFIGVCYAMNYHDEHLIGKAPLTLPIHHDTIRVHEPLHLKQVAEVLGLPVEQLRDLNPQYRRDVLPAKAGAPYALRIPGASVSPFIDLQDSIFSYKDSVFFANGKQLLTPQRYAYSRVDLPEDKYDRLNYTVRSGDNVGFIADWYDVRSSDLRYWNNISRNLIRTGQKLVIYKPKGQAARYRDIDQMSFAEKQRMAGRTVQAASASTGNSAAVTGDTGGDDADYVTYTVRPGDTLWEIARDYPGVSETDIARLNKLGSGSSIKPGQVLRIRRKG